MAIPSTIGLNLEVALEENPTSRDPHDLKPRPAQALEQILFSTVVGGAVIGQFTTVFVAITRLFNPNDRRLVDFLPPIAQPPLGDVEKRLSKAVSFPSPKDVENAVALVGANNAMLNTFEGNTFQALKMLGRLLEKAMVVGKLGGITLVGRGEAKPKDTVATLIPIAQKREDALKATFTLPIPTVVRTRFRHNVNE